MIIIDIQESMNVQIIQTRNNDTKISDRISKYFNEENKQFLH